MNPELATRLRAAAHDAETSFTGELDDPVQPCTAVQAWVWPDVEAPPRPDRDVVAVLVGEAEDVVELAPQLVVPRRDPDVEVIEGE